MYELYLDERFLRQCKTLEERTRTGTLSENNMNSLIKFNRCFIKLIENPFAPSLKSTPYTPMNKFLKKTLRKPLICYHSYIENNSGRIYWYCGSRGLTIVGIANHNKKGAMPTFHDLANEDFNAISGVDLVY